MHVSMGIISKIGGLFTTDELLTRGSKKAAEGRSDLSDLAGKLDDMRGDNISFGGEAAKIPGADKIADTVEAAKIIGVVNTRSEGRVLGEG